jgi:hypothetical protein
MDTTKLVGQDMRALKVDQKVTLSEALPGGGATGVVTEVAKWHVVVVVAARIEGVDGAYCIDFDYAGNVTMFYDWTDSKAGWDHSYATTCPIPELKIVSIKEDPEVK